MKNDNQFFTTEIATAYWLHSMGVEKYTINEDLTINVDDNVWIDNKKLDYIPVQFGIVNGYFGCCGNSLKTLKGCPIEVNGSFDCSNNKITSLEGCPLEVNGSFDCSNNKITSLEGCPLEIGLDFYCSDNELTSLKHCPKEIKGSLVCLNNKITHFKHGPDRVKRVLNCSHNRLTSFCDMDIKVGRNFLCYRNPIIDFSYLEFEVKGDIGFTPTDDMNYLNKDKDGDIIINFNDFKKLQALSKLNEKLTKELPINPINIKQKI